MKKFIEVQHLNLERTLFCGQAFRWKKLDGNSFFGISGKRTVTVEQNKNGITFCDISDSDLEYWLNYFDVKTDYAKIVEQFSSDPTLKKACDFSSGIRVLRQEPFETLISFIISQNNHIPRIAGIIERLCEMFGEKAKNGYFFPTPERLSSLSADDLTAIGTGYRAPYILGAAETVYNGKIDLEALRILDADSAKTELLKLKGVGDKVADCVLLFAYGKTTQVPKDVWIKRVLLEYYPEGLPECAAEYSGIAQQFLFDYIRHISKKGR